MDIESVREYCLSLPMVTEDMAFGTECLLLRVCNKIFACLNLEGHDNVAVKSDPEYAIELREKYLEIEPAWHWNKRYWNQLSLNGGLQPETIQSLIRHSYSEVVKSLPRKVRIENPEICAVK